MTIIEPSSTIGQFPKLVTIAMPPVYFTMRSCHQPLSFPAAWHGPGTVALVELPQPVVHAIEAQAAVAQAPAHHGAHAVSVAREQPGKKGHHGPFLQLGSGKLWKSEI